IDPHRDVTSVDQAGVVGRPVPDTVARLRLARLALVPAHLLEAKNRESSQETELLTGVLDWLLGVNVNRSLARPIYATTPLDANTGQLRAALMTHQDVADGEVLPELLDQIPTDEPIDTIGGDGAYDTQTCYAEIAARDAMPSIPPREGAVHWPSTTPGAAQRNEAIDAIARGSRREWKQQSGYHRRSLAENAMCRFKTLTGPCLWARRADTQATEVAVRVGVPNRMAKLARPQSVRIA
ncbi:MAG: IS5 family transposase, partial [Burkholderia sp.]